MRFADQLLISEDPRFYARNILSPRDIQDKTQNYSLNPRITRRLEQRLHRVPSHEVDSQSNPNLTYASLMTLANFRQSPVTRHTPVALETTHTWPTFALTGLGVAGVGHAAKPIAVAQTRTAGVVRAEGGGLPIRAAAVPRIRALYHLDPLDWKGGERSLCGKSWKSSPTRSLLEIRAAAR